MIISTKSWHYRWMKFLGLRRPPPTLCEYFWTFVYKNFLLLVMVIAALFIGLFIPVSLWSWLHNGSHDAKVLFFVFSGTVVFLCGLHFFVEHEDRIIDALNSKPLSFWGVIVGTLRAAKTKVCPLIKYEE